MADFVYDNVALPAAKTPDIKTIPAGLATSYWGQTDANAVFDALTSLRGTVAVVNVMSPKFGTKGDGATDDTAAIQAAVNAVTAPGTVVFTGGKTYKLNGTITVPIGVSIDGCGAVLDLTSHTSVVFDYNPGGGALSFNQPPTVFQRFRVNGNAANTNTRLVQTFRVPFFTMRDVTAFSVNIAKINGGNVITKFDQVVAYQPAGTVFWFTIGSDTFGPNFTTLEHVWIENAQNSGVVGVRVDSGDIRIHDSYFEQLPLMVWLNGGAVALYDSSFNFRGWPAQCLLINGAAGVSNPSVIIDSCDFNLGESTSTSNTQVLIETTVGVSVQVTNSRFDAFNSVNAPATVFKSDSPNGQIFGTITGCRFFAQGQAGFQELLSIFDPTTVAAGIGYVTFAGNFLYGAAAAVNGQIDITKAGATGSMTQMVFVGNNFLRATNLLRLDAGLVQSNNFQGVTPVISWSGAAGVLKDNTFGFSVPTLTNSLPAVQYSAQTLSRVVLTYGATVNTDASVGTAFEITATNTTAFTIAAPTNPTIGQPIRYIIRNASGGVLGAITWNAAFKINATAIAPANGQSRTVDFLYNGTNWVEQWRGALDVPN